LGGANLCAVEEITNSRSKAFAPARLHQSYIAVLGSQNFWESRSWGAVATRK